MTKRVRTQRVDQGRQGARLKDVAQLAGVSSATVSRGLNNPDALEPETLARVQEAVRKLRYVPNGQARALRSHVADLRLKVDETLTPGALAARAGSKLGMIPASPNSLRTLSDTTRGAGGLLPRLWARLERIGPLRS